MSNQDLPFLPEIIPYRGDWQAFVTLAYFAFKADFLDSTPRIHGHPVSVNISKNDGDPMEEGFWHLITRKDKQTKVRLPEIPRAERITSA